jgi:hypothetical protein
MIHGQRGGRWKEARDGARQKKRCGRIGSVKLTARLLLDLVNDFIRHAKVLDVVSPDVALWDLVEFVSVLITVEKEARGAGGSNQVLFQVRIDLCVFVRVVVLIGWMGVLCMHGYMYV